MMYKVVSIQPVVDCFSNFSDEALFQEGVNSYFGLAEPRVDYAFDCLNSLIRRSDVAPELLTDAMFHLGILHWEETGFDRDGRCVSAEVYLKKAAEDGHEEAAYQLSEYYKNHTEYQVRWLRVASRLQHKVAAYQLGRRYLYGNGVIRDRCYAINYLILSMKLGYSPAARLLGEITLRHASTKQEIRKGVRYLNKAAWSGDLKAMKRLVQHYLSKESMVISLAFCWAKRQAICGDFDDLISISTQARDVNSLNFNNLLLAYDGFITAAKLGHEESISMAVELDHKMYALYYSSLLIDFWARWANHSC